MSMSLTSLQSVCWSGWCRSRHSWSGLDRGDMLRRWRWPWQRMQWDAVPTAHREESWLSQSRVTRVRRQILLPPRVPSRRRHIRVRRRARPHCRHSPPTEPRSRSQGGRRRRRRRLRCPRCPRRDRTPTLQPASAKPRYDLMTLPLLIALVHSMANFALGNGSSNVICCGETWWSLVIFNDE